MMKTNRIPLFRKANGSYRLHQHVNLRYFVDLVLEEARAGLRAEASRGYLGVLWWFFEPLLYMGIFYTVFTHLLRRGDESFVLFLLTGLIVWKWFHASLNTGSKSLMANAGLMNRVYLPKIVFPLAVIAINTYKFFIILILFLVFLQFMSIKPSLTWIMLPVLLLIQLSLIAAVTCLLAAVMPFFSDLRVILDNILIMCFFLSGIFFDITNLPAAIQGYLWLNPMAIMIAMYRRLLLTGLPLDWGKLSYVLLFSFLGLFLAFWLFQRFDRVYPKIVH